MARGKEASNMGGMRAGARDGRNSKAGEATERDAQRSVLVMGGEEKMVENE